MGELPPGTERTPRWVIAFAAVAFVLVVLFVVRHLGGGAMAQHLPR